MRARAPRFGRWWNEETTWAESPMEQVLDWMDEEIVQREHGSDTDD